MIEEQNATTLEGADDSNFGQIVEKYEERKRLAGVLKEWKTEFFTPLQDTLTATQVLTDAITLEIDASPFYDISQKHNDQGNTIISERSGALAREFLITESDGRKNLRFNIFDHRVGAPQHHILGHASQAENGSPYIKLELPKADVVITNAPITS